VSTKLVAIHYVPKDMASSSYQILLLKKYFDAGVISRCLEDYHSPIMNFYAVYPNGQNISKKLQIFIDFLIKQFKKLSS